MRRVQSVKMKRMAGGSRSLYLIFKRSYKQWVRSGRPKAGAPEAIPNTRAVRRHRWRESTKESRWSRQQRKRNSRQR